MMRSIAVMNQKGGVGKTTRRDAYCDDCEWKVGQSIGEEAEFSLGGVDIRTP
ncbi:MAG: hypothetical protein HUK22_05615 [Thermoguttaceae bacterium]|nr:hypothetical protein [Thermoguttaceae bacterium]